MQRLKKFQDATRYGPIFVCSSCEQKMFYSWVCEIDEDLRRVIIEKNLDTFNKVFRKGFIEVVVRNIEDGKAKMTRKSYICITCKNI